MGVVRTAAHVRRKEEARRKIDEMLEGCARGDGAVG